MKIKYVVLASLMVGGLFSFVYGSKNKVVNLQTFHDYLEAYVADFGIYPEALDPATEETIMRYGKNSYIVQISEMSDLMRSSGYAIHYSTADDGRSYLFQMRRGDFCKQLSSNSERPTNC